MRPLLVLALLFATFFAGCAQPAPAPEEGAVPGSTEGGFRVPGVRVGDVFRYGFGFKGPTFEAGGITDVKILERATVPDGSGKPRDALHVVQSSPDGGFQETYWVDADTLAQFKRDRRVNYSEVSRFPIEPLKPVPMRHASYGNGTGTEELYKEDPLFEDYSFFGGFGSGRTIPAVGGELGIPGHFWLRDENRVLAVHENLTGKVDKAAEHEQWGPLRHVVFKLDWREGDDHETMDWSGSFSPRVPLAVETLRVIKAKIGSRTIDVAFNATLISYEPGEGEEIRRTKEQAPQSRREAEFGAWTTAPPDGNSKLLFPLSEALKTLASDPTATQFFQQHTGAYLQVAHMSETNTCGFNPQSAYPGCHWYEWSGRYVAPDDYHMDFKVEKFADASGGAPAYVPYASRDYPFEVVFGLGSGQVPPQTPQQPVVVAKAQTDYPPRAELSPDTLTIAGAVAAWKATAWSNLSALEPNLAVVFVTPQGYGYFLSHEEWVFPSQNPELVFFYDEGPLVLVRHSAYIEPSGHVIESLNFHSQVTQR